MNTTMVEATGRFLHSPGLKFFLLGLLCLVLLIPASLVWLLVSERQDRARDVAREVAQSWGGSQRIVGPFIIVPYELQVTEISDGEQVSTTVRREAVFLPDSLTVDMRAATEVRSRGIFDVTVFTTDMTLAGRFNAPSQRSITDEQARFLWSQARFAVGLSSVRAIRNAVALNWGDENIPFEPSLGSAISAPGVFTDSRPHGGSQPRVTMDGIHVPNLFNHGPQSVEFSVNLILNGSESIFLAPAGRDTRAVMDSNWPHPSFTGGALPERSLINDDGFGAEWSIPHLARAVPLAFDLAGNDYLGRLAQDAFGVRFFQPVDYYALVDRALKYAVLFIGVVFLAVFVIELRAGKHVHVVQYVFVGLALILFYVLLLSLAEHFGFLTAYLAGGGATAALIGSYCARSMQSAWLGALVLAIVGAVFGVLYTFLRLEDYALLAGSIFAFIVLAVAMFLTQKIDWSGRAYRRRAPSDEAMTQA
ncbi:MAG: cell envelope integrity protein CreD [Pseudomonadota bacterium]